MGIFSLPLLFFFLLFFFCISKKSNLCILYGKLNRHWNFTIRKLNMRFVKTVPMDLVCNRVLILFYKKVRLYVSDRIFFEKA